jgi:beta-lactamase superfamily II metal-dependent hydrolase
MDALSRNRTRWRMHWSDSLSTCIWIFSVGRGNAAFVRTGLNHGFIVDMGAANGFNPAGFVAQHFARHLDPYKNSRIAQAILSHPHSDHITQCGQLEDGVLYPSLLTCPNEKEYDDDRGNQEKLNWKRVVNPRGTEELTEAYKSLYAKRSLPLQTIGFEATGPCRTLSMVFSTFAHRSARRFTKVTTTNMATLQVFFCICATATTLCSSPET